MALSGLRRSIRSCTIFTLIVSLGASPAYSGQTYPVSPAELQAAIVTETRTRQDNRERVLSFLSTPRAAKALRAAHVDLTQVKTAISSLTSEELARLAARSAKAEADFAAGRLSDRDLLIVLVGIAALILIIVAVD